jgi:signal transduction histidine kinase
LEETLTKLDQVGEQVRVAVEAGDLDALREIARRLLAGEDGAEHLEHLERLAHLGQQAAELVHELRQPLLAIKGYAQLILERPTDGGFVKRTAETLVEQSERMEEVLERVRSYSGAAKPTSAPARAAVNRAIDSAARLLDHQLRKRNLRVDRDLADDLPEVGVDLVSLQQILINLLANARDAIAGGQGAIRVRTALVDGMVEVSVSDDGPGVPAALKPRLFEPFATGKAGGVGLGLALSRTIAERAGGTLELVDSDVGATFRLRLPPG